MGDNGRIGKAGNCGPAPRLSSARSSLSQVHRTCSPAARAAPHYKKAWPRYP